MLILNLSLTLVSTPNGRLVRVTDLTNWSAAAQPRAAYNLVLVGVKLGSVQAQDVLLAPVAYDPVLFQSGANPVGTVDVPLPGDGVFRFMAEAQPLSGGEAEAGTDGYVHQEFALQSALARLNLAYLEAGTHKRAALLKEYIQADLLITGAGRQYGLGFYADAATSMTAAERLFGIFLPGFHQSAAAYPAKGGSVAGMLMLQSNEDPNAYVS